MQMIEIAKAFSYNAKIVTMDEPTSSLSEKEVEHLFKIIQKLKGSRLLKRRNGKRRKHDRIRSHGMAFNRLNTQI